MSAAMMPKRRRGATLESIIPLIMEGAATAQIARQTGLSPSLVNVTIAAYDLRNWIEVDDGFSPPLWQDLGLSGREQWVEAGLKTGRPLGQVAATMGTTLHAVRKWRARHVCAAMVPPLRPILLTAFSHTYRPVGSSAFNPEISMQTKICDAGPAWDALACSRPVAALDRGKTCAWPLWRIADPARGRKACGAPSAPGRSYCAEHMALSVAAPIDSTNQPGGVAA